MNVGGLLLILISVAFDVLLVMLVSARLIFVPMYHGSGFCCPQLEYVYTSTDSKGLVKVLVLSRLPRWSRLHVVAFSLFSGMLLD